MNAFTLHRNPIILILGFESKAKVLGIIEGSSFRLRV